MRLPVLIATALLSAPAFAADLGTYRPGTPYHSVIVPTANICESQCSGDALCRSWNYVKVSPDAPGVCEFHSNAGPAVSSAISISGVSQTASPQSARLVQGGTNTIRVGTSVQRSSQPIVSETGERRIVREAVPSPTPIRQPMTAGAPQRFQPALDGGVRPSGAPYVRPATSQSSARVPAHPRGPVRQPYAQRQMPPAIQGSPAPGTRMANPQPIRSSGRPPIGQPIEAPQPQTIPANAPRLSTAMNMPRASAQAPVTWQNAPQYQSAQAPNSGTASATAPRTAPAAAQPQPAPSNGGSLYGGLNDDVVANMPTVSSAPTMAVSQSPLAGGPPR